MTLCLFALVSIGLAESAEVSILICRELLFESDDKDSNESFNSFWFNTNICSFNRVTFCFSLFKFCCNICSDAFLNCEKQLNLMKVNLNKFYTSSLTILFNSSIWFWIHLCVSFWVESFLNFINKYFQNLKFFLWLKITKFTLFNWCWSCLISSMSRLRANWLWSNWSLSRISSSLI